MVQRSPAVNSRQFCCAILLSLWFVPFNATRYTYAQISRNPFITLLIQVTRLNALLHS